MKLSRYCQRLNNEPDDGENVTVIGGPNRIQVKSSKCPIHPLAGEGTRKMIQSARIWLFNLVMLTCYFRIVAGICSVGRTARVTKASSLVICPLRLLTSVVCSPQIALWFVSCLCPIHECVVDWICIKLIADRIVASSGQHYRLILIVGVVNSNSSIAGQLKHSEVLS